MPSHCGSACACACTKIKYVHKDLELTEEEYQKVKSVLGDLESEKEKEVKKARHNQKIQKEIDELNFKISALERCKL